MADSLNGYLREAADLLLAHADPDHNSAHRLAELAACLQTLDLGLQGFAHHQAAVEAVNLALAHRTCLQLIDSLGVTAGRNLLQTLFEQTAEDRVSLPAVNHNGRNGHIWGSYP